LSTDFPVTKLTVPNVAALKTNAFSQNCKFKVGFCGMEWDLRCNTTGQTLLPFLGAKAPAEQAKCSNVPFHQAFVHFREPAAEADPAGDSLNSPDFPIQSIPLPCPMALRST
jgi:hypothetical protein